MKRDPQRWLDTQLPVRLQRALESAAEDGQPAQLERLERRVAIALGAEWGAWSSEMSSGIEALPRSGRPPAPIEPAAAAGAGDAAMLAHGASMGIKGVLALSLSVTLGIAALYTAVEHAGDLGHAAQPPRPAAAPAAHSARRAESTAEAAAVQPTPEAAASTAAPPPARGRRPRSARETGLSAEVEQLDAIREHLQHAPALALQAAAAHERRFPRGELAQERELLRIEALFRLGRAGEARARADRLAGASAGGAYRAQVQRLVARYAATTP